MKKPQPILVADLFPELLDGLVELLTSLSAEDWNRRTVCPQWTVKDIASHLLGGECGILSRKRDAYPTSGKEIESWEELVALINSLNRVWVEATQRISPRLMCDLFKFTGPQVCDYFASLDPYSMGGPVDWAGSGPAPVWLDLAREYTERWHHQQQIRDAVSQPGLKEPRLFAPVLDAFVRALPHTFRNTDAKEGTTVRLTILGDAGERWILRREQTVWNLYVAEPEIDSRMAIDAETIIDQDIAWRLFSRGVEVDQARSAASLLGDQALAAKTLEMISVIA
jgi:uncharacterized protein (TIGR03083 family)